MSEVEEILLPPSSNNERKSSMNNKKTAFMRKTSSSLFDQSIKNDKRLLKNIYAINETIMNTPETQKVIAKRERRLSEAKEAKTKEKSQFRKDMERIIKINHGEINDDEEENIDENDKKEDNTNINTDEGKNKNKKQEKKEKSKDKNIKEKNKGKTETNNNKNGKANKDNNDSINNKDNKSSEENEPQPQNPKDKENNVLKNLLSQLQRENDEDRLKQEEEERERQERERQEKEAKEAEANKDEQTSNENNNSEIDESDVDENAYDDFYSSENESSTESSIDEYNTNSVDNNAFPKNFTIKNTLPHVTKSKSKKSKRNNVNTYFVDQSEMSPIDKTVEDGFIDFILYHTDIAKPKLPDNSNDTNINQSGIPIKNNPPSVLNRQMSSKQEIQDIQDITDQRIQYHLSHMPILGSARNYKKKTNKDELIDKLNDYFRRGESSDSIDEFDPIHSK